MTKLISEPGLFFMFYFATTFAGYLLARKISGHVNAFLSGIVKIAFYSCVILSGIAAASTIGDVANNVTAIIQTLFFVGGSTTGLGTAIYATKGCK